MKLDNLYESVVSEGWRDVLGATALSAATAFGNVPKASAAPPQPQKPIATMPAQTQVLSDKEIGELIKEFTKNKTKESANIVLDEITKSIEAKEKAEDFKGAIRLNRKAVQVARSVKSNRYKDFQNLNKELIKKDRLHRTKQNLHRALDRDPTNKITREKLIKLYLLKYDAITKAAKLVTSDVNKNLQAVISTAQKDINQLSEDELLTIGKWYYINGKSEAKALGHAKIYIKRFLELHTKKDSKYLQANKLLNSISNKILKLKPFKGNIVANKPWQPTVKLRKGERITISAKGIWWPGTRDEYKSTPDGPVDRRFKGYGWYLEGKIGNTGQIFKVGSNRKITVPYSGMLYLQMHDNDSTHKGGRGRIQIIIKLN